MTNLRYDVISNSAISAILGHPYHLGIPECGFCLFENLISAETGKKHCPARPHRKSIFSNEYAAQTLLFRTSPLAARGWG